MERDPVVALPARLLSGCGILPFFRSLGKANEVGHRSGHFVLEQPDRERVQGRRRVVSRIGAEPVDAAHDRRRGEGKIVADDHRI